MLFAINDMTVPLTQLYAELDDALKTLIEKGTRSCLWMQHCDQRLT